MNFDRTGFILYTEKYEECVIFYKNMLGLKERFHTDDLTCFQFGNSYLMVEIDDVTDFSTVRESNRVRTCLRMNVPDVKVLADQLRAKGIEVNVMERSWGTVAKFFDPDGNLCAFRDSATFEAQVQGL